MNLIEESCIRFVNLDSRWDRLDLMTKACNEAHIPATRVRGMLPSEYKGNPKRVEVMQNRTPGAIGCWFSQVKIMQEALKQKKHAWVMEDDLIFCKDFHLRLHYMEQYLAKCNWWDILWLGATFHVNPPYWHKQDLGRDAETTEDPHILRTFGAFCTYAYIVRDRSIERVLHLLDEWLLDPAITYLNHPTVGATPRRVLAAQRALQDEIERQPSRFLLRELTSVIVGAWRPERPRMRVAADRVAAFVGAHGDDLVFVDNATTGANGVLRSFPFEPGDEILVSDLGYGGVTLAATFAARERGATVRTVTIPTPYSSDGISDAFERAAGPRTRLAVRRPLPTSGKRSTRSS